MPNEIAQVQAKGRARAEDSRMYTIVSTRSNREFWYLVQEEKEKMAHEAIGCLEYDTLQQNICRKQISFIEEREKARKMAEAFREIWPDSENVELLCKLCKRVVCKGNDITILAQIPTTSYQTKSLEKHIIRKHMIKQKPENSQSRTESFAMKRAVEINGASMVCGKKQDFNFLS